MKLVGDYNEFYCNDTEERMGNKQNKDCKYMNWNYGYSLAK